MQEGSTSDRDHTGHRVSRCCLAPPPGLVTDPQLAAAAGDFNSPWVLAPDPGGLRLITQRDTSDRPINTQTLVFAIGLKALAVAIDHTIVLTASAWQIWIAKKSKTSEVKFIKSTVDTIPKKSMWKRMLKGEENVFSASPGLVYLGSATLIQALNLHRNLIYERNTVLIRRLC